MYLLAQLLRGADDVLRRDDSRFDGRRGVEVGTVLTSLPVHDGTDVFRFQTETLAVNGLYLSGESLHHIGHAVIRIITG